MLTDFNQPSPLVSTYLGTQAPGTVLDAGCETGRNSLYLARLGWQVTAIDTNAEAVAALNQASELAALPLKALAADIITYQSAQKFDAVVCLMTLHYLASAAIGPTLKRLQAMTQPGGINIISAFTSNNPVGTRPRLLAPAELTDSYADWNIELDEVGPTSWVAVPAQLVSARYEAVRIVARRPV